MGNNSQLVYNSSSAAKAMECLLDMQDLENRPEFGKLKNEYPPTTRYSLEDDSAVKEPWTYTNEATSTLAFAIMSFDSALAEFDESIRSRYLAYVNGPLLETYKSTLREELDSGKLHMSEDAMEHYSEEDFIRDMQKVLSQEYGSFEELNSAIFDVKSFYSVINEEEALDIATGINIDEETLASLSSEEQVDFFARREQARDILEELGYDPDEYIGGIDANSEQGQEKIQELAQLLVLASVNAAHSFTAGTGDNSVNTSMYEVQDAYYSSEMGKQALLENFIEACKNQGINDEYNAVANTEYIKYCMQNNRDWLMEDFQMFADTIDKINLDPNFSSQVKLDATTDSELISQLETYEKENGFLPFNIEKIGGDYYVREYSMFGEQMLYYMDYHTGENVGNVGEDRIITAFSTQGYADATHRSYKNNWIDSHIGNYETYEQAERDYYVLSGVIKDERRYEELASQGELSLKQITDFLDLHPGTSLDVILDPEYIKQHKEEILESTGWKEEQLYNFSIALMSEEDIETFGAEVASEMWANRVLLSTLGSTGIQVFGGVAKFGENVVDALDMALHSDIMLAEDGMAYFESKAEFDAYKQQIWEDYINNHPEIYQMEYDEFYNSQAALDAAVSRLIEYDPETWTYYVNNGKLIRPSFSSYEEARQYLGDEESIREVSEEYISILFKNNKMSEWSLSDSSAQNYYIATFKEGIRNGGDFSSFDSLDSTVVQNAAIQFDTMERVAIDRVGNFMEDSIYSKEWYKSMEDYSFVKHDNILGMTANQIGSMAIPVLASVFVPGTPLSSMLLFTSAFGGASEEAILGGGSYNEALTYAMLSATTELVIEKLFSGIAGYGTGWLDNVLSLIPNKFLSATGLNANLGAQIVKRLFVNGLGESIEEVTTDIITPLWQSLTYMNERSWGDILSENFTLENEMQTALVSFLSSMVFGSGNVSSQMKQYNRQMSNLEQMIGEIPGMREQGRKVLAEIIGNEQGLTSPQIIERIIQNNAVELANNSDAQAAVRELHNKLVEAQNKINEGQTAINVDGTNVNLSNAAVLNLIDSANLSGKFNIENGTLTFDSDKAKTNFVESLYKTAKSQLSSITKAYTQNIIDYKNALVAKDYTKLQDAIDSIVSHVTPDVAFGPTISLQVNETTVEIPVKFVAQFSKSLGIKANVDGNTVLFEDGTGNAKFADAVYEQVTKLLTETRKSVSDTIVDINADMTNHTSNNIDVAVETLNNTVANDNSSVIIKDLQQVTGEDLTKLEIIYKDGNTTREVNVFVDSSTNGRVYREQGFTEAIKDAISENQDTRNIYVGKLSYKWITDKITSETRDSGFEYVNRENASDLRQVEELTRAYESEKAEISARYDEQVSNATETEIAEIEQNRQQELIALENNYIVQTQQIASGIVSSQVISETNERIVKAAAVSATAMSASSIIDSSIESQAQTDTQDETVEIETNETKVRTIAEIKNDVKNYIISIKTELQEKINEEAETTEDKVIFDSKVEELKTNYILRFNEILYQCCNEIREKQKSDASKVMDESKRSELIDKQEIEMDEFISDARTEFEKAINKIKVPDKFKPDFEYGEAASISNSSNAVKTAQIRTQIENIISKIESASTAVEIKTIVDTFKQQLNEMIESRLNDVSLESLISFFGNSTSTYINEFQMIKEELLHEIDEACSNKKVDEIQSNLSSRITRVNNAFINILRQDLASHVSNIIDSKSSEKLVEVLTQSYQNNTLRSDLRTIYETITKSDSSSESLNTALNELEVITNEVDAAQIMSSLRPVSDVTAHTSIEFGDVSIQIESSVELTDIQRQTISDALSKFGSIIKSNPSLVNKIVIRNEYCPKNGIFKLKFHNKLPFYAANSADLSTGTIEIWNGVVTEDAIIENVARLIANNLVNNGYIEIKDILTKGFGGKDTRIEHIVKSKPRHDNVNSIIADSISKMWTKAILLDGKIVSEYGQIDISADFADSIVEYVKNKEQFGRDYSYRYALLSQIFNESSVYTQLDNSRGKIGPGLKKTLIQNAQTAEINNHSTRYNNLSYATFHLMEMGTVLGETVYGTHNKDLFYELINNYNVNKAESDKIKIVSVETIAPGILEIDYQIGSNAINKKTVYDTSIISEQKLFDSIMKAADNTVSKKYSGQGYMQYGVTEDGILITYCKENPNNAGPKQFSSIYPCKYATMIFPYPNSNNDKISVQLDVSATKLAIENYVKLCNAIKEIIQKSINISSITPTTRDEQLNQIRYVVNGIITVDPTTNEFVIKDESNLETITLDSVVSESISTDHISIDGFNVPSYIIEKYGSEVVNTLKSIYEDRFEFSSLVGKMDMSVIEGVKNLINELSTLDTSDLKLNELSEKLSYIDGRHILNFGKFVLNDESPIMLPKELYDEYGYERLNEFVELIRSNFKFEDFVVNPDLELLNWVKGTLLQDSRFDSNIIENSKILFKFIDELLDGKVLINLSNCKANNFESPLLIDKELYEKYKNELQKFAKVISNSYSMENFIRKMDLNELQLIARLMDETRFDFRSNPQADKLFFAIENLLENKVIANLRESIYSNESPEFVSLDYYEANKKTIEEYLRIISSDYQILEFLKNPNMEMLNKIKSLIEEVGVLSSKESAMRFYYAITEISYSNTILNLDNFIYQKASAVSAKNQLINRFGELNSSGIDISILYSLVDSSYNLYRFLNGETVYGKYDYDEVFKALELLLDVSSELGISDSKLEEISKIVEILKDDSLEMNEKIDKISELYVEANTVEGYYEAKKIYLETGIFEDAISALEGKYSVEQISNIILTFSSRTDSVKVSKEYYYKAFDYLVEKGYDQKKAAKTIYKQSQRLLDQRGSRILLTTPEGINIRIVNNANMSNLNITVEELVEKLKDAYAFYGETDLKDIYLYDVFSPRNLYAEYIQYEDYIRKYGIKRAAAAATASNDTMYIWTDFNDINSVIHEYAHTVDRHLATAVSATRFSKTEEWAEAIQKDKSVTSEPVTAYCEASNAEDFAEFVEYFYIKPVEMALKYPNRYEVVSKYLDLQQRIVEYVKDSNVTEILEQVSHSDGSLIDILCDYIFEGSGKSELIENIFKGLDAKYETKEDILKDIDLSVISQDIKQKLNISSKKMLEILKDYIDGKDVSRYFDSTQYLEIIKKYDLEEVRDYYYEELMNATAELDIFETTETESSNEASIGLRIPDDSDLEHGVSTDEYVSPKKEIDLSQIRSSVELIDVLATSNSQKENEIRDKNSLSKWLEKIKSGIKTSFTYESMDGYADDSSRIISSTFDDNGSGSIISGNKTENIPLSEFDYRITFKNSSKINSDDAIAFINTLIKEANKRNIYLRAKNYWESDAFILYLTQEEMLETVKLLEELKDDSIYGEAVSRATKSFGTPTAFSATISNAPYYGISMAHSGLKEGVTSRIKSKTFSNTTNTFNGYLDEIANNAYNKLLEKYNGDSSKIMVDELYDYIVKEHSIYVVGNDSINIPLWMNHKNYISYLSNGADVKYDTSKVFKNVDTSNGLKSPTELDSIVDFNEEKNSVYKVLESYSFDDSDISITHGIVKKYGEDTIKKFISLYENFIKDKKELRNLIISNDIDLIKNIRSIISEISDGNNSILMQIDKLLTPLDGRDVLNLFEYISRYGIEPISFPNELYLEYSNQIKSLVEIVQSPFEYIRFLENPNIELLNELKNGLFSDERFEPKITEKIKFIYDYMNELLSGKVIINADSVGINYLNEPIFISKEAFEQYGDEFYTLGEKLSNEYFIRFLEESDVDYKEIKKLLDVIKDEISISKNGNLKKLESIIDKLIDGYEVSNVYDFVHNDAAPEFILKEDADNLRFYEKTIANELNLLDALHGYDIELLDKLKSIIESQNIKPNSDLEIKLHEFIREYSNGNIIVNKIEYIRHNFESVTIPVEVLMEYKKLNGRSFLMELNELFELVSGNVDVFKLLNGGFVSFRYDVDEVVKSLENFVQSANQLNVLDNDFVNKVNELLSIYKDNSISIEEKYDRLALFNIKNYSPKGYKLFVDVYAKTNNLSKAIKTLEKEGYTSENIAEVMLSYGYHSSLKANKEYYYKAYDYLVEKGMSEETASKYISDAANKLLELRGTRIVATTPSGINIRIVNSANMSNVSITSSQISKIIEEAEKMYSKTDLKDIYIYDTFDPENIYCEKVSYKDYSKKQKSRFISAASANDVKIIIWTDFNNIYSLYHEYGHNIDYALKKELGLSKPFSETEEWIKAMEADKLITKAPITEYATASNMEDFAEFIEEFKKNPIGIAFKYPNRYKIVSKYLDLKISEEHLSSNMHNPIKLFSNISKLMSSKRKVGTIRLLRDYIRGEFIDIYDNPLLVSIFEELDKRYPTRITILKDIKCKFIVNEIINYIDVVTDNWYYSLKNFFDRKVLSSKLKDSNIELNSDTHLYSKSVFDMFRKPSYDLELFTRVLETGSISDLNAVDLYNLVSAIKNKKINLKKYNLDSKSVRILIENGVPISKMYSFSRTNTVKTFIEYFGMDTISRFDDLNNGFLLSNDAEMLEEIHRFFDYEIPNIKSIDKYTELETLITNAINTYRENYLFNHEGLIGTDYASRHQELFLDESAPSELKDLYYNKQINSSNKYNEEWFSYLEGKSIFGIITEKQVGLFETSYLKDINEHGNSLSNKFEKQLQELSNRLGIPVSEIKLVLDSKMSDLVENSSFGVRRTMKSLSQILEDGRLKNQFEVNETSFGVKDPTLRFEVELEQMGVPTNLRYEDRPIYGMLLPNIDGNNLYSNIKYLKDGPGSYYSDGNGVIYIFDKTKVIDTTTISLGDSLSERESICSTSAKNPEFFGALEEALASIKTKEDLENFEFSNLYRMSGSDIRSSSYYELQIHGKDAHTLDNLKEILFMKKPSDDIIKRLKELNIPWRVIDKKISSGDDGSLILEPTSSIGENAPQMKPKTFIQEIFDRFGSKYAQRAIDRIFDKYSELPKQEIAREVLSVCFESGKTKTRLYADALYDKLYQTEGENAAQIINDVYQKIIDNIEFERVTIPLHDNLSILVPKGTKVNLKLRYQIGNMISRSSILREKNIEIKLVDTFAPSTYLHRQRTGLSNYVVTGEVSSSSNKITLYNQGELVKDRTVEHELAHIIIDNDISLKRAWERVIEKDGNHINEYTERVIEEDFSESMVEVSRNTEEFARKHPHRFVYMINMELVPRHILNRASLPLEIKAYLEYSDKLYPRFHHRDGLTYEEIKEFFKDGKICDSFIDYLIKNQIYSVRLEPFIENKSFIKYLELDEFYHLGLSTEQINEFFKDGKINDSFYKYMVEKKYSSLLSLCKDNLIEIESLVEYLVSERKFTAIRELIISMKDISFEFIQDIKMKECLKAIQKISKTSDSAARLFVEYINDNYDVLKEEDMNIEGLVKYLVSERKFTAIRELIISMKEISFEFIQDTKMKECLKAIQKISKTSDTAARLFVECINDNYDVLKEEDMNIEGLVKYLLSERKFTAIGELIISMKDISFEFIQDTKMKECLKAIQKISRTSDSAARLFVECINDNYDVLKEEDMNIEGLVKYLLFERKFTAIGELIISMKDISFEFIQDTKMKEFAKAIQRISKVSDSAARLFVKCINDNYGVLKEEDMNIEGLVKYLLSERKFSEIRELMISMKDISFEFIQDIKMKECLKAIQRISKVSDSAVDLFIEYINDNYGVLNEDEMDVVADLVLRINKSNSIEVKTSYQQFIKSLLKQKHPLESLEMIEDIFLRNNLPYVGKIMKIFEVLYSKNMDVIESGLLFKNEYISPYLKSKWEIGSDEEVALGIEKVIFRDLVRIALKSNNKSIRDYIENIKVGSRIFESVKSEEDFQTLTSDEVQILQIFASHLDMLYSSIKGRTIYKKDLSLYENISRIKRIFTRNYKNNLTDSIISIFCHDAGFDTLEQVERYMSDEISKADRRNREYAQQLLETDSAVMIGKYDAIKGISDTKYLEAMLQNGIVPGELIPEDTHYDTTPLGIDWWMRIKETEDTLLDAFKETGADEYLIQIIMSNRDNRFNITRYSDNVDLKTDSETFDLDLPEFYYCNTYFNTQNYGHYDSRTGVSFADITCFAVSDNIAKQRLIFEIVKNGYYIPVVDKNTGKLVFTPSEFDLLRENMRGLSYYGIDGYKSSSSLETTSKSITDDLFSYLCTVDSPLMKFGIVEEIIGKKEIGIISEIKEEILDDFKLIEEGNIAKLSREKTDELYDKLKNGEFDSIIRTKIKSDDRLSMLLRISELDVVRKRKAVNDAIREVLSEFGLGLKTEIDGDITPGFVEVIDTGSTGRKSNLPGDGDFDFTIRIDSARFDDSRFMSSLSDALKRKFESLESTKTDTERPIVKDAIGNDIRYENVKIEGLDVLVDIDISFVQRTNKVNYSTDMSLSDRYSSMDVRTSDLVVANVIRIKQLMKEFNCYKPARKDPNQGGFGGVGYENLILQNGGSLYSAAMSFIEATRTITFKEYLSINPGSTFIEYMESTELKTFDEFYQSYSLWDFGKNHFAEKKHVYPHDNFVNNMIEPKGNQERYLEMIVEQAEELKNRYKRMIEAFETYLRTAKIDSSIELIKVEDLQMESGLSLERGSVNINKSYSNYSYIIKPKTSLSSAIDEIINSNYKGNILLEIPNTSELSIELISRIPSNVEVRIIGGYNLDFYQGFKSKNDSAVAALTHVTYTLDELKDIMHEISEFEKGIDPNWTDMEKARYAYEYLSNNIKYNPDPVGRNIGREKQFDGLLSLVKKESTCQGFSQTYQELLSRMGIQSAIVNGRFTGSKGMGHVYNVVTINNESFIVDTVRKFQKEPHNIGSGFNVENIFEYEYRSSVSLNDEIRRNALMELITSKELVLEAIEKGYYRGISIQELIDEGYFDVSTSPEIKQIIEKYLSDKI